MILRDGQRMAHTFFPRPRLSAYSHSALFRVPRGHGQGKVAAQPQVARGRVRCDGPPAMQCRKKRERKRGAHLRQPHAIQMMEVGTGTKGIDSNFNIDVMIFCKNIYKYDVHLRSAIEEFV